MNFSHRLAITLATLSLCSLPAATAQLSPQVTELYQRAQHAQGTGNSAEAVADYRKIIKLDPSLGAAYNNLGRLLFNLGQFAEAANVLAAGLQVEPEMHPAQIMLGASYLALGQPKSALAPLQAGVEAMPDDRFARLTLARTLLALEQPEQAVPQLQAMLRSSPKDQEAWYLLGKVHLELSQRAFAEVQSIDPAAPLAHLLEGEIMESMQNSPGAIEAYKRAIAAAPADAAPLEHLANLYRHLADWAHARTSYQQLILMQPGNCTAHWKLADALDSLGEQQQEALDQVNLALQQCPSLVQAHAERARLLIRLKRPAEALDDLKIAEHAAPDEPTLQPLFAQAYLALGNRAAADAARQRFVALELARHQAEENRAASVTKANQP